LAKKNRKIPVFEDVLRAYTSRREFIKGSATFGASALLMSCTVREQKSAQSLLTFKELPQIIDENFSVAEGYEKQVLIRWGDPIVGESGEFSPEQLNEHEQLRRFGYNNDFVGFLPLPMGSKASNRGLLVVNHEFTTTELMFPGSPVGTALTKKQALVDIAAHGVSIVEVRLENDQWQVDRTSKYNRRITPDTPMHMSGPAAGSVRLKTIMSADGVSTLGTYGNCSGGVTPWGTVLTGEENVDAYFSGDYTATDEAENYHRFGITKRLKNWGDYFDRWNLDKNPHELLHAGWIVEIDPYDTESVPKKRTGLGRFKHEGCNVVINDDGHVVAYTGDDQQFEYIYKFVSKNLYEENNRAANMDILEEGTLYAARFFEDGSLQWLPLEHGSGPLTEKNGFKNQADILIDVRKAADLLGATPMDRPEDIEVNLFNGKVYAMLTNNRRRQPEQLDPANPRPYNSHGQVIEFWPKNGDHTLEKFRWELFLLAGNPQDTITLYHPDVSEYGWLTCPDNCAFDALGNLWIATDGGKYSGIADGIWATEVTGNYRALTKRFMKVPVGAEMCGPFFTPDDENLFCAVQHPAGGSTYEQPSTRWPDFSTSMPPRPAVVVTRKTGGGRIGT